MTSPKFRIWNKKRNTWHCKEVSLFGEVILTGELLRSEIDGKVIGLEELEDLVVMQYTPLKDDNGLQIAEGDILRNPLYDSPGAYQVVVFDDKLQDSDIPYQGAGWMISGQLDELEVIGNIYESPQLLEATS